jgi:hypothetical protein
MPTLATQASCKPKPLIQIAPASSDFATSTPASASISPRSSQWPA